MANPRPRIQLVFRDANGQMRGISWIDNGASGYETVAADIAQLSNATLFYQVYQLWQVENLPPINPTAAYPDVSDVAILEYQTDNGTGNPGVVRIVIPAPKSTIFLPDGVTVAAGQISQLTADCEKYVSDVAGRPVVRFSTGRRSQMALVRY